MTTSHWGRDWLLSPWISQVFFRYILTNLSTDDGSLACILGRIFCALKKQPRPDDALLIQLRIALSHPFPLADDHGQQDALDAVTYIFERIDKDIPDAAFKFLPPAMFTYTVSCCGITQMRSSQLGDGCLYLPIICPHDENQQYFGVDFLIRKEWDKLVQQTKCPSNCKDQPEVNIYCSNIHPTDGVIILAPLFLCGCSFRWISEHPSRARVPIGTTHANRNLCIHTGKSSSLLHIFLWLDWSYLEQAWSICSHTCYMRQWTPRHPWKTRGSYIPLPKPGRERTYGGWRNRHTYGSNRCLRYLPATFLTPIRPPNGKQRFHLGPIPTTTLRWHLYGPFGWLHWHGALWHFFSRV